MVLRKNVPQDGLVPRPLSQATNNPPYPLTPSEERANPLPAASDHPAVYSPDLNTSPAFQLKPLDEVQTKKDPVEDESDYSENEWDQSDDEDEEDKPRNELPDPLKIGGGKPLPAPTADKKNELPQALRVGPPAGIDIKKPPQISPEPTGATSSSAASNSSMHLQTNNPYLKMQQTGQSNFGAESSAQVWGDVDPHAGKYDDPVELPTHQTPATPTNPMANLRLEDVSPPIHAADPSNHPPALAVEPATPLANPWPQQPTDPPPPPPTIDASSIDAFAQRYGGSDEAKVQTNTQQPLLDQSYPPVQQPAVRSDHGSLAPVPNQPAPTAIQPSLLEEEQAPPLPPRRSQEEPLPPLPLRPLQTGTLPPANAAPESPNTVMNRQRKETYQIKHIRWHDVNKPGIRSSPILTQNLNGPCPLLALVNALVLSTPAEVETALVDTLRTREQISLGLLLDAVFDELMSGRRGDAAQELPDVGDLYKFLLALHTGLNVNPMFVQDPDATDGTSTTTSHAAKPGGFENTRDMRLYRTFNLALMHGWLPEPGSEAYQAFERIAKTYETSQYVQFQEEELDAKLQSGDALTSDEQQMFTDIHAIKEFLSQWPTQLTNHGLKTMRETLQPGQIAILFRNDHFSTLYKDPRTDRLVTLVTDQGYSSHDEIVWESLVDVNGQGSELFSGDFRPVGNSISPQRTHDAQQQSMGSMLDVNDNEGWTTVPYRGNQRTTSSSALQPTQESTAPLTPAEQEDHDLALALQLQEEEDDRHRRSQEERRRRENELSENAIAAQSQSRPQNQRTTRPGETPPTIPPRRANAQTVRPSNEPAPPPTYEEAATNPPYHPPQGHPASPTAPVRPQGSGFPPNNPGMAPNSPPQMHGRRNSRPGMQQQQQSHMRPGGGRPPPHIAAPNGGNQEKDKCVVM